MPGHLIYETRVTDWVETAGKPGWEDSTIAAYRIWMRRTLWGYLQRHEWRRHGQNSTDKDPWIRSAGGFNANMRAPE